MRHSSPAPHVSDSKRSLFDLVVDGVAYTLMTCLRKRARRKGYLQKIAVPIDDVIGMRLASTGSFELTQMDGIKALLSSLGSRGLAQGAFIDIGANIGVYTIALAGLFRHVFAFEANPVTYRILEANVALTALSNVTCCGKGVSDSTRQATLYTPKDGNLGWATLHAEHHPASRAVTQTSVSLDTLDNLSETLGFANMPIAFLKIDVEGHEAEVLSGCVKLLDTCNPIVAFEVLDAAMGEKSISLLKKHGYSHFYTFRRGIAPGAGIWKRYRDALVHGLPVIIEEVDASRLRHAALLCAVKSN